MKRLLLQEDDNMFDCAVTDNDLVLFWKNSKYFYKMIASQPVGFWIQFVTSFRALMYKKGFVAWRDDRLVYAEQSFIAMLDILTEKDSQTRNQKVSQVFQDVKMLQSVYKKTTRTVYHPVFQDIVLRSETTYTVMKQSEKNALKRLYGTDEDVVKTSRVFLLWSRFVGALAVCFKRWRKAKTTTDARLSWTPPAHWRDKIKRIRAISFELHLKEKWSRNIGHLVGMQTTSIVWIHNLNRKELDEKLSRLPMCIATLLEAFSAASLCPWDNSADREFRTLTQKKASPKQEVERQMVPYTPTLPTPPPSRPRSPPRYRPSPQSNRHRPQRSTLEDALVQMFYREMFMEMMFRSFSYNRYGFYRPAYTYNIDDDDNNDDSNYDDGNLQSCANCKVVEPRPGYYKSCKRCKDEHVSSPKYYCDRQCQVDDWKKFHKWEHSKK